MKPLEINFKSNANQTGVQQFHQVKQGVNLDGRNVYIYQRTSADGKVFGFEVLIPNIKKAGTYSFPNDRTITYLEDFEEYPGASLFGRVAWFCANLKDAEKRFDWIMENKPTTTNESDKIRQNPAKSEVPDSAGLVKHRGRQKVEHAPLIIPVDEFSVKELAEMNKVEYITAANFLKEQKATGSVKFTRAERRSERGPMTKLFTKV